MVIPPESPAHGRDTMTRLERALLDIISFLTTSGRGWALVGGLAVSCRAEPRFTRDVDLAVVAHHDRAAESLVRDLITLDYGVISIVEQEAAGRLATARLLPPDEPEGGVVVDLLFASSGIEQEIVELAEPIEVFPGVVAPVARTGHLIALKLLSRDDIRRPQDASDLRALLEISGDDDLLLAKVAVAVIGDRGYHRGRSLIDEYDRLLLGSGRSQPSTLGGGGR